MREGLKQKEEGDADLEGDREGVEIGSHNSADLIDYLSERLLEGGREPGGYIQIPSVGS